MSNEIVTLVTKIRPTKKLFVIELNAFDLFYKIVKFTSEELSGLYNIILINNNNLYLENTFKFIERHNPDIIINYTEINSNLLSTHFRTPCINLSPDKLPEHLRTPLFTVNNLPPILRAFSNTESYDVFSCFDEGDSEEILLYQLHFGHVNQEIVEQLKSSIFKNARIQSITSMETFFELCTRPEKNFLHLSMALSNAGEGFSVWHEDYNPNNYFKDHPTVVIGSWDNLESIVYFWNMRATYPNNVTIWLTTGLYQTHADSLTQFNHICDFTHSPESYSNEEKVTMIDISQYYFSSYSEEWKSYETYHNVVLNYDKLRIYHPLDRMFSNIGLNVGCTLDISGSDKFKFPKSVELGNHLVSLPDQNKFPHYFARTSPLGLSIYAERFNPLENTPLIEDISLPNRTAIFQALFLERGLELKETTGTKMADQVVELLGGIDQLHILQNQYIFELLYALTPKSIEKLTRTVSQRLPTEFDEDIRQIIEAMVEPFTTIASNIIVDIEQMSSMISLPRGKKKETYPLIEQLYNKKILLRGKSFPCPNCSNTIWISLELISNENKCYGCNQSIFIPIFSNERILADHFRINELIARAIDQGLLPLFLLMHLLYKQGFYGTRMINNQEIYKSGSNQMLSEVDLLFTIGHRVGLAEVKANRGFEEKQVERLLNTASIVKADLLIFSTLKSKTSDEVNALTTQLNQHNLTIPALILTQEVLFEEDVVSIDTFFRRNAHHYTFPVGPILIE